MKKQMIKIMAGFAIVLGITLNASAQGSNNQNMTSDQRVEMHLKKMTEKLNLTQAQIPQVKSLLEKEEKARTENPNNREANHAAMTEGMSKILTADQMKEYNAMQAERQGKQQGKTPAPAKTPATTK